MLTYRFTTDEFFVLSFGIAENEYPYWLVAVVPGAIDDGSEDEVWCLRLTEPQHDRAAGLEGTGLEIAVVATEIVMGSGDIGKDYSFDGACFGSALDVDRV